MAGAGFAVKATVCHGCCSCKLEEGPCAAVGSKSALNEFFNCCLDSKPFLHVDFAEQAHRDYIFQNDVIAC